LIAATNFSLSGVSIPAAYQARGVDALGLSPMFFRMPSSVLVVIPEHGDCALEAVVAELLRKRNGLLPAKPI